MRHLYNEAVHLPEVPGVPLYLQPYGESQEPPGGLWGLLLTPVRSQQAQ